MTEKERFQRAFAPLHASPDTMTEVMKMTEQKHGKRALRRAATLGLAAALVLALGSVAYASDLGGIQRTVQLWLNGEMTDATLTVNEGSYTLRYPDKGGTEHEMGGGGIAIEDDGTERALTEEEMLEHLNAPEVVYEDDGTVMIYYRDQKLDVTDKFDEDGVCYVQLEGGEKTIYMTIKRGNGYATSTTKYILPSELTTERKTRKVPHSDAVRNLSPIGESLAEFRARRHEIKSDRFSPRRVRGEKHLSRSVCRAAILAARHGAQRGLLQKAEKPLFGRYYFCALP